MAEIGKRIHTIGELRELIEDLNDNDLVCIETIDKYGDVEDLYPMYIDVIDGIKLESGETVNEVRFCQMPNTDRTIPEVPQTDREKLYEGEDK
jgi:hypothetical protein